MGRTDMRDSILRFGMLLRHEGRNHLVGGVDRYVQVSSRTFCGIPVNPDELTGRTMDLCESVLGDEERCRELDICEKCLEELARHCGRVP